MPTNYQFQPLPLENESQFEDFIMDLFNELHPGKRYEIYGRRGQNQDGIDIVCFSEKIVIQCKKKELANTTSNEKKIKTKLLTDFRNDLHSAVNSNNIQFDKFIFATTFPTDIDLQNLARDLSVQFNKDVEYFSWGNISYKLHYCPAVIQKYYKSFILESTRISDSKFKELVKNKNIIDQCYESLKRFEGFNFIDPRILSRAFPFKVNDTRTYPMYQNFCLSSDNEAIIDLFNIIEIKQDTYKLKKDNPKEILCKNVDEKVTYIQNILRKNLIHCIQTNDEIHHKIPKYNHGNCNCNACIIEELKFSELMNIIDNQPNSLSSVYGYYKLHNFSKAKSELKLFLKNESNPIKISIGLYNEYWLSILNSNDRVSQFEFSSKLRRLEFDSEPVQEAILNLEHDKILTESHHKLDKLLQEIKRIFTSYKRSGFQTTGPNYVNQLTLEAIIVYSYFRNNLLIKDIYTEYNDFFKKALTGWLLSLNTSLKYDNRLKKLEQFQIAMSVYCLNGKDLLSVFKETETISFEVSDQACEFLRKIASNYFGQFNNETSIYGEYLKTSFSLASSHRGIFQSLLINLSYSSIDKCPDNLFFSLLNFIKKEDFLYPYDYSFIGILFNKKGTWFSIDEHLEMLNYHINSDMLCSKELIYNLLYSIKLNHNNYHLEDFIVAKSIINSIRLDISSSEIICYLRDISSGILLKKIDELLMEKLKNEFDSDLFRQLLMDNVPIVSENNLLFTKYIQYINNNKFGSVTTDKNGFEVVNNYEFLNFVSAIVYSKSKTLDDPIINDNLTNLSSYQKWLIDPEKFNYDNFKIDWIHLSDLKIVLKHLGKSEKLKKVVLEELRIKPNKELGEIYIKMIT